MVKQTTAFMIMIFVGVTNCLPANGTSISVFPETWFEITNEGGMRLYAEQGIVWVGLGDHSSRGFWQYSISDIASQFSSIAHVSFRISNIADTQNLHLHFREADFNFKLGDWTAYENNSFFQSTGYFTNPESEIDLTAGFNRALDLGIENLGIMIFRPGQYAFLPHFSGFEPASNAEIIITGNPIPEPSTMILLATGLIGLVGWRRNRFKNR